MFKYNNLKPFKQQCKEELTENQKEQNTTLVRLLKFGNELGKTAVIGLNQSNLLVLSPAKRLKCRFKPNLFILLFQAVCAQLCLSFPTCSSLLGKHCASTTVTTDGRLRERELSRIQQVLCHSKVD